MATWEDGPEYAPLERPAEFARPEVAPLSVAPPVEQMAAYAPKQRPAFDDPPAPVAPLETLLPVVEETRDPQEPFAVVSSTLTSDSAWGALHWGPPTGPPANPLPPNSVPPPPYGPPAPYGPPTIIGRPAPNEPLEIRSAAPVPGPNGYPVPGTPGWFAPPAYGERPTPPGEIGAKPVLDAATPGLCICLTIGGLVYVLAPVLLVVALGLTSRVKVAHRQVRRAFGIGLALLAVIATIAALTNDGSGFGAWWTVIGGWALVICWGLLLTTLLLVYRGLKSDGPPPPIRSTWG
jgi:hypothetical protein